MLVPSLKGRSPSRLITCSATSSGIGQVTRYPVFSVRSVTNAQLAGQHKIYGSREPHSVAHILITCRENLHNFVFRGWNNFLSSSSLGGLNDFTGDESIHSDSTQNLKNDLSRSSCLDESARRTSNCF